MTSDDPRTPEALAALHGRVFSTPRPWTADEFAALLDRPDVFLLQVPGGFLLGRTIAGEAELLTLAVDPDLRRQGRGAALLERFVACARDRGAETAFLEVAEANAAAIALYRGAGWTDAGRRRGYYRGPDGTAADALVLVRTLA